MTISRSHEYIDSVLTSPGDIEAAFKYDDIEISWGDSNPEALKGLKDLREDFVTALGWFERPHDDTDRYDENPNTLHLALYDNSNAEAERRQIAAGMRLTQIGSVEDSLSWSMLERNPLMRLEAHEHIDKNGLNSIQELNRVAADGNLWDLTRMVNPLDGSVKPEKIVGAMVELIGMGIAKTSRRGEKKDFDDLAWLFITTPSMKNALDHLGIENEVVARDYVSEGDKDVSYVCYAKPADALREVYQGKDADLKYLFTQENVAKGLSKADAVFRSMHEV